MPGPFNQIPGGRRSQPQPAVQQVAVSQDDFCPCPNCGEMFFDQVFKVAIVPTFTVGEKQMGLTPFMRCVNCGKCFSFDQLTPLKAKKTEPENVLK